MKKILCVLLSAIMLTGVFSTIPVSTSAMEEPMTEEAAPLQENTLSVSTSAKKVKIADLKKKAQTVKPVKISGGIGTIKVTKVKKGTTSSIYSKITVNAKTAAITIKKGSYKEGVYKIKITVKASGNKNCSPATSTVTAKVNIYSKLANPIKISSKMKDVTTGVLKKGKKTISAFTVKKAKGKVTYKKVKKGTTSSIYKKISFNKKGAIVFKKGTYKKGKYKIKVKATAKGNKDYKSKSVTSTVLIRIAKKFVKCSHCGGTGKNTCSNCNGSGKVYTGWTMTYYDAWGRPTHSVRQTTTCGSCNGSGKFTCSHCYGTGKDIG